MLVMFKLISLVALGGALGSSARFSAYLVFKHFYPNADFPFATLSINILGGIAIGFAIYGFHLKFGDNLHAFWVAGILGGFTTFSAFSLESYSLFLHGLYASMIFYILLSIILSITGVVLGAFLATQILS